MSWEKFTAELVGTAILIILGDGVVANVLLTRSKAQNAGWIVITAGWGFAVMAAVSTRSFVMLARIAARYGTSAAAAPLMMSRASASVNFWSA